MKVSIIGAGNIGGAIAGGLANGKLIKTEDITCADISTDIRSRILEQYPLINVTAQNREAAKNADIIILSVKPWLIEQVIDDLHEVLDFDKQIIVSIAAGIPLSKLTDMLLRGSKDIQTAIPTVFRVIPNIAAEVTESMSFIANFNATEEQTELISNIFSEIGQAMVIEESLMEGATSLASCGIAFVFKYIRAASEAGVELGFYPKQAQAIVLQTIKGAVELLNEQNIHPEEAIDKVTTPGGITIKGINELDHAGFSSAIIRAIKVSK